MWFYRQVPIHNINLNYREAVRGGASLRLATTPTAKSGFKKLMAQFNKHAIIFLQTKNQITIAFGFQTNS